MGIKYDININYLEFSPPVIFSWIKFLFNPLILKGLCFNIKSAVTNLSLETDVII